MERRQFSGGMQGKNLRYLSDNPQQSTSVTRVGFLLLEHFSLPAFTQTLDTLVTANLLRPDLFATRTFGWGEGEVFSDLGLVIRPDANLMLASLQDLDLLVICGGFRTELKASEPFIPWLRSAGEAGVRLAGLWNGSWFLGRAGLLQGYRCAIHPEHRPALAEVSKAAQVTSEPYVIDRDRLTASSPSGAFHMALDWIKSLHGKALVEGIEDILAFEQFPRRKAEDVDAAASDVGEHAVRQGLTVDDGRRVVDQTPELRLLELQLGLCLHQVTVLFLERVVRGLELFDARHELLVDGGQLLVFARDGLGRLPQAAHVPALGEDELDLSA